MQPNNTAGQYHWTAYDAHTSLDIVYDGTSYWDVNGYYKDNGRLGEWISSTFSLADHPTGALPAVTGIQPIAGSAWTDTLILEFVPEATGNLVLPAANTVKITTGFDSFNGTAYTQTGTMMPSILSSHRLGYTATYANNTLTLSVWVEKDGSAVNVASMKNVCLLNGDGTAMAGANWPDSSTSTNGVFVFSKGLTLNAGSRLIFSSTATVDGQDVNFKIGMARP